MGARLEAKSAEVRKRIEKHEFENEEGEEYGSSKFGGFNDYFRRKKIKLQNLDQALRSSAEGNRPIFRGVVAHVNGYTQPSLNDLHTLVVSYGGGFVQYLDGKTMVTHIIASNLTPKKRVEFAKYRIVKPAWVVDSIQAGKLLPWDSYRVVDEGVGQRVLGFDNGNIVSQVNSNTHGYKGQTDTSWYTGQVKHVAQQVDLRPDDFSLPKIQALSSAQRSSHATPGSPVRQNNRNGRNEETGVLSDTSDDVSEGYGSDDDGLRANYEQTVQENLRCRSGSGFSSTADKPTTAASGNVCNIILERGALPEPTSPYSTSAFGDEGSLPPGTLSEGDGSKTKTADDALSDISDDENEQARTGAFSSPDSLCEDRNGQRMDEERGAPSRAQDKTPEEHNATLLADPKVWKSTVVNPGFLKQYYEESRLHHLSTWKAALKSQLQALASEKSSSQKSREKSAPGSRRYILHIDFDSFFAAVSLRKCPQYVDKPVVVAHGNGSGAEIASCNYPARKFGIKNGMWMKHAQKMCPDLKVLPYDFKGYEDASRSFYEAIISTGGVVQSVSVDEALVDVSMQCIAAGGHDGRGIHEGSIWREQAKADAIATHLREQVKEKTGCAVSVGIGGNILLAKVALRKAKPAGQFHLKPEEVLDFLGELTMPDLPGIAYSIGGKLEEIGVKYVKDVRQISKERMVSVLGPKTGEKIWDYSRGIDKSEVGHQVIRKSVSAEVNWGIRFVTMEQVDEFIYCLAEELHKRLLNEGVKGRQLTMKIMRRAPDAPLDPPKHLGHGKCDTFSKSLVLGVSTNDPSILGREALAILKGFGFSPGELRGLGIQMQKLEPLKSTAQNPFESSQRRLQFKSTTPRRVALPSELDRVEDIESPQKPIVPPSPHPALISMKGTSPGDRPNAPLNTFGTQFVLPSQVDPAVLKELPHDIRSKLFQNGLPDSIKGHPEKLHPTARIEASRAEIMEAIKNSDQSSYRPTTPAVPEEAGPSHSQIDKETLDALPPEVRTEVLAYYAKSPHKARTQAVLPQSPRKDRAIRSPKKLTTPTKPRRGRPIGGGGFKAAASAYPTLTQSNFVANPKASVSKDTLTSISDGFADGEISAEFLSALPEDIRDEIVAQARRDRLQKKFGLDIAAKKKRPAPPKALPPGQRTLTLPPRPPKPTFTAKAYTTLSELRTAMTAWHDEFKGEAPDEEDISALIKYLRRVVADERDMNKSVSITKWLRWVVEQDANPARAWIDAVKRVEEGVQEAIRSRGLGRVEL